MCWVESGRVWIANLMLDLDAPFKAARQAWRDIFSTESLSAFENDLVPQEDPPPSPPAAMPLALDGLAVPDIQNDEPPPAANISAPTDHSVPNQDLHPAEPMDVEEAAPSSQLDSGSVPVWSAHGTVASTSQTIGITGLFSRKNLAPTDWTIIGGYNKRRRVDPAIIPPVSMHLS